MLDLQAHLYKTQGMFVVELERNNASEQRINLSHLFLNMQKQMTELSVEQEVIPYFNSIAKLVRELMTYDSVMVYRFDSDWNGEVIAQDSIEDAPLYVGTNFPASDIPSQARRLYTLNLVRLIVDIDATPIPFLPSLNPISRQPLDMAHSVLRSLSPIHVEYLRNMGVNASMSISIMQNDRLWGLIACHHFSPKHVSIHMREMALFVGRMVSTQVSSIEASQRLGLVDRTEHVISKLLNLVHNVKLADLLKSFLPDLQVLLNSTGIICVVEGQFYHYGETLNSSEIKKLLTWTHVHQIDEVFCTNHLSSHFKLAKGNAHLAAGVIVAKLTSDMNNCIIWLRKEKPRTVHWAGKYDEGLHQDEKGDFKISPRKSFAIWSELLQGQSEIWCEAELLTVKSLVRSLSETFAKKSRLESSLAKQKLIDAEMRVAAAAFEAKEGIVVTDANTVILRVNKAFTEITGFEAAEAIGQTPRMLSSGRHDKAFYSEMWHHINNVGSWEGEVWNVRKNGEIYPEHLTISAVKDANGVVTNYVGSLSDITLSKAASEKIENLAFYDALTQLPNRRLLIDRLKQALAASARSKQCGALLFIDLDHFKDLNDTLGHDVGDLLLQQVGKRIGNCLREGDTVARFGGDEFVVLLEDLSGQKMDAARQTESIANKILVTLNQPYQLATHPHLNSSSIGATLFSDHELELEDLLKYADIAMYDAKRAGRNTLRFFDPKMQEAINLRAELERDLRVAQEKNQLQLYYQIQVDAAGKPLGAEALIRWNHPARGLVPPFNFIPLAEETGLILSIGQWVLDAACTQLKAWENDPLTCHLEISINVSAKQFKRPDFTNQVLKTLQEHDINPKLLKLELTESMLVDNVYETVLNMVALQVIGVRFELDDFGTGYSSLQYLKQLPLHRLKIDQSFVRDIEVDDSDRTLIQTIITMAQSLGVEVIAEGVETEQQRQFLLNSGCRHYQGYLFSKPVPIDEFEALLRKS